MSANDSLKRLREKGLFRMAIETSCKRRNREYCHSCTECVMVFNNFKTVMKTCLVEFYNLYFVNLNDVA